MTGSLTAEWLKLRSVRSTWYATGVAAAGILLAALWSTYVTRVYDAATAEHQAHFRAAAPEQGFLPLLEVCFAVVGVLAITSEHATGTIRASLAAVPRRGALLAAKAVVVGVVTLVAAEAIVFAMFAVGRALTGDRPMGFNESSVGETLPLLLASGALVAAVALVGLGLGAALRSTAGALIAVVALLFVVPTAANALPGDWSDRVRSVMLPDLGYQLAGSDYLGGLLLPPWAAAATLAGYVGVALGSAAAVLMRRDVR